MNNTYSFSFCHQKGKEPKGKSADCTCAAKNEGFCLQKNNSLRSTDFFALRQIPSIF